MGALAFVGAARLARIPRLSATAAITVAGLMVAMNPEASAACERGGLTCQVSRPRELDTS